MIEVFIELDAPEVEEDWVRAVAALTVDGEAGEKPGDLSLILVDNAEIQRLNLAYLNKDRPTDVIAFPLEDEDDDVWGEIYISAEQARLQAEQYSVPPLHELARLIIHGVLHLTGYDDTDEIKKAEMTGREEFYLDKLIASAKVPAP